jgi:hypothetical protein
MRARQWRGTIWAARLGLVALAINALVPVHIAFDLAEALAPAHLCGAQIESGGAEGRLLALLSGHRDADGKSDEHGKHHACPVCSALGFLAGLAAPPLVALSVPEATGSPAALSATQTEIAGTLAGYRSRAPPAA